MISAIQEIRQAWYGNINTVSFWVLIIYQLICIQQRRKNPSFCVEGVQSCFNRTNQHFFGSLSQELPLYKKIFNKVLSFLSKDYLWIVLETFLMANFIQYYTGFTSPFGDLVGTGANYYALLFVNSSLLVLYCCIVGINPLKHFDWIAPSYALALIVAKFACFCSGCCYGIEWEHGIYSYRNERYEVPVQLIEAFWALLIFIFMMCYKKKVKRGTFFPILQNRSCSRSFSRSKSRKS